jgi:hypothetical protein
VAFVLVLVVSVVVFIVVILFCARSAHHDSSLCRATQSSAARPRMRASARVVTIEAPVARANKMRKTDVVFIDQNQVAVSAESFISANELRVTVGTNCPQGGDSGHGGRTVLILENPNGDFRCGVDGAATLHASKIEIVAGGDSEFETLIRGLEFAVETLRLLVRANTARDGKPQFQPAE